ncbi:XRE family transcriptional regulator [Castellaniella sp. MT123]|uniref:XRE family transcriptional regulator n=1 Tax=Castellaniella sp. MT123 TaxID=3140381 RepID=UPI0031F368BC
MMTGSQCRAARALINLKRAHLAEASDVPERDIEQFEHQLVALPDSAVQAMQQALEHCGAVFINEGSAGVGVQLKFTCSDAQQVEQMEDEGGPAADDKVL